MFYILITYIVCSEVFVFAWLEWATSGECCSEHPGQTLDQMLDAEIGTLTSAQRRTFKVFYYLVAFVCAPIALPVMLVLLTREVWTSHAEDKRERGTFREVLLDPLHPLNVPKKLQPFLDEQTPTAINAGFEPLGDFWLKPEPVNGKGRLFLHKSGECFWEIGIVYGMLYVSCISCLDDGSMVETAQCSFPKGKVGKFARHGVFIQANQDYKPADLIDAHHEQLARLTSERGTVVRVITMDRWQDYYRYHNRKFAMAQHQIGELPEPPVCEFPEYREPVNA